MRIKNKRRFTIFIIILMIVSGLVGYFIKAVVYANDCETVNEETVEKIEIPEPIATIDFDDLGIYTITAYCGCEKCCGEWSSDPVIGAGNVELIEGVHCASPLPLGTVVEIDGLGCYEVQDKTASWVAEKYDDKIIDIYFENHEDAVKFGKKTARVKEVREI